MRMNLKCLIASMLMATWAGAAVAADAVVGELAIGMSEAEVGEAYPDGTLTTDGVTVDIRGRYGNFRRAGETFEGGLTMFKLEPSGIGSAEDCASFYDTFKTSLVQSHGEPAREDFTGGDVEAKQAAWQLTGLHVGLESAWYGSQGQCRAEVFVRATDIEPM